jgi:hypothetical protein
MRFMHVKTIIVCGGAPDTSAAAVQCSPVALICVLREHGENLYFTFLINHSSVTLWVYIPFILKFDLKSEGRKFSCVFRSIESRSGNRSGTDERCEREGELK